MRTILAIPGIIFSIIALIVMFLGLIPLLGWLNWINIPIAVVGLLFSLLGRSRTGSVLSIVVIVIGLFRLQMGWGII